MLLTYVDESYDSTHYWICGVSCRDSDAIALSGALDDVVRRASEAYGLPFTAELHGHDLFHGKGPWAPLALRPRARIGVYNAAFDAIAAHACAVYTRGVHVRRLRERYANPYHPHAVVLAHLLERVDEHAEASDDCALVIADEIDRANAYRSDLWSFQRSGTTGYRARRLTRIVDTIHFAPSSASRLLQAADLVAFLQRRRAADADRDPRAQRANAALWQRIEHLIQAPGLWYP